MNKIKLSVLKCKRCGHSWIPRQIKVNVCPKCHSKLWNKKKMVKK
jgi:Zn finger protein HypA/HybF involved in hydrogenase expression